MNDHQHRFHPPNTLQNAHQSPFGQILVNLAQFDNISAHMDYFIAHFIGFYDLIDIIYVMLCKFISLKCINPIVFCAIKYSSRLVCEAHISNLNDNYLQFCNARLPMYCEVLFAVLIERNKIVDWNEMTAIWEHSLADIMREEQTVANQSILRGNHVKYAVQSCYVCNTALIDLFW